LVFIVSVIIMSVASTPGLALGKIGLQRTIDPIVTSDWLEKNIALEGLVILDVRPEGAYASGHIPGSINEPFLVPFSAWITMRDGLLLELPEEEILFDAIGSLGIDTTSKVVVVSEPNEVPNEDGIKEPPFYGLAAATRVADTLIYAGVVDVAVLNGGYPGWVIEGLAVNEEVPTVTPVVFDGAVDRDMFVSKEYVRSRLFYADLIDARDPDVYFGVAIEDFAPEPGHIFGAASLPAPWIWDHEDNGAYMFKDTELLDQMASKVTHWGLREVIVYCGVGGYASAWWYVLTQVLGYNNVRFYDGSAQEWTTVYDMVPFRWQ
jgi:thiosulfate/3-mercaptopyruvate sulfurtransferase